MNINRNNYEIWLIDYLDGKLSPAEEEGLQLFLTANPDLKEEFDSFEFMPLEVVEITYEPKSTLKKKQIQAVGHINEDNYENYFIASSENDLGPADLDQLEGFIKKNPNLKQELDLFYRLKMKPDKGLIYTDKDGLKKQRKLPAFWISAASAAAVALLLISIGILNWEQTSAADRLSYNIPLLKTRQAQQITAPQTAFYFLMDVPKTNILILPDLPDEGPFSVDQIPLKSIEFLLAYQNDHQLLHKAPASENLMASVSNLSGTKQKTLLGRIIQHQSDLVVNNLKTRRDARRQHRNDTKEPLIYKLLDQGILVFNTVTGNSTSPVKTYNQDGQLLRYQLEGELLTLDRSITVPNSVP